MNQGPRVQSFGIPDIADSYLVRNFFGALSTMLEDRTTTGAFIVLLIILMIGAFGPMIAPYDYTETHYAEDGSILTSESPSAAHLLGTNSAGQDVFSKILYGARPTMLTGVLAGSIIILIGTTIGVISGYLGGHVDNILMRMTDLVYGIPVIPAAIVLSALLGTGYLTSVLVIGLILWRGPARVIRSQVLQIKERPFILSAKTLGGSTPHIIVKHILPNVAPMAVLYFAINMGYSIIIQAGLAFLGVANPFLPSWGVMVRNAYNSGLMATAWWWSIPPGILISITVLATYMFGRGYEAVAGQTSADTFKDM